MELAYLDPGSGSLIASAVVGGVAAIGVVARSARSKVTGVFSRKGKADDGEGAEVDAADDEAVDVASSDS